MIICCGEALIDMMPMSSDTDAPVFQAIAGGAIFNTVIGLGRLGIDTGIVAGISSDLFGQQLRQALTESNVSSQYLVSSNLPTTLAFVQLINGQATYTFYDENTAGCTIALTDIWLLGKSVHCLYFGGISLISEPGADTYCQLAELHSTDMVIMLDPNIRPSFIVDEQGYRTRLQRMIAIADIVKVSDEDLDWLVPAGADIAEKVLRFRQPANQLVIVTRGHNSALAFGAASMLVEQDVIKVEVVDTVGAGDTYNAGLLASLQQQGCLTKSAVANLTLTQISQALAHASRVAAVTVSRTGANPPWANEIS